MQNNDNNNNNNSGNNSSINTNTIINNTNNNNNFKISYYVYIHTNAECNKILNLQPIDQNTDDNCNNDRYDDDDTKMRQDNPYDRNKLIIIL
jgi:hypothetical protein